MIYKGIALGPDGVPHKFTSNNEFHPLDGLKVDRMMFAANISSRENVDELMDFLQIAKVCLDPISATKKPEIFDEMQKIYGHFEKDHIHNVEDLEKESNP